MAKNPFNPLDWFSSAQDWFAKTEKSSGFRPYLIYLILVFGISIYLLSFLGHVKYVNTIALGMIVVSSLLFIILYFLKSLTEPNFCRSEIHIQKIKKIELEAMGNESNKIKGQALELKQTTTEDKFISHDNDIINNGNGN